MSDSDEFYDACEEESSTPARKAIVEQELAKSPRPNLAVEAKEIEGVEKAMAILSNKDAASLKGPDLTELEAQAQAQALLGASADDQEEAEGDGGYRFDTPEHKAALKAQRAQIWSWLKNIGSNMMRDGINLTKISLPVCLFEARSFLERMTTNWDYLDLLIKASTFEDPVERMKHVVTFAIAGCCRQISFHKPFNPILGETYQSKYPNGVEVYCEQISHHPPVSSWQMVDPAGRFVFSGNGNWVAGIKGNSVRGRQTGINRIDFKDGSYITYELPGIIVKGVLWGSRCIKYGGEMKFVDHKNGVECDVLVDPQPQTGLISSWFRSKKSQGYKPDLITGVIKKNGQPVGSCNGNWLHYLDWEQGAPASPARGLACTLSRSASSTSVSSPSSNGSAVRVWDRKSIPLPSPVPLENPLMSDCRHRQDLIFLKQGDQVKAQDWKHQLEEVQRRDRKLRKEGGGYEH